MGGFGQPFGSWGLGGSLGMQQMSPQLSQLQMMGMAQQAESAMLFGRRIGATPDMSMGMTPPLNAWEARNRPPKKKCVCAYCGRPAKLTQENACKGCGAWEVEFK